VTLLNQAGLLLLLLLLLLQWSCVLLRRSPLLMLWPGLGPTSQAPAILPAAAPAHKGPLEGVRPQER
jgi:hypothetical protein